MASVAPKKKSGRIVSYKFKTCVGRDTQGRRFILCVNGIFIFPSSNTDDVTAQAKGDIGVLEALLGFDPGDLGDSPVRMKPSRVAHAFWKRAPFSSIRVRQLI